VQTHAAPAPAAALLSARHIPVFIVTRLGSRPPILVYCRAGPHTLFETDPERTLSARGLCPRQAPFSVDPPIAGLPEP